jgi:hypothetical protein
MIRKLKSGGYRLYSRKLNPKTGKCRNLGTFKTRAGVERHERAVQYFKRQGRDHLLHRTFVSAKAVEGRPFLIARRKYGFRGRFFAAPRNDNC